MEISELVHRQLVSSTLQGHFRDRLENLVMVRAYLLVDFQMFKQIVRYKTSHGNSKLHHGNDGGMIQDWGTSKMIQSCVVWLG